MIYNYIDNRGYCTSIKNIDFKINEVFISKNYPNVLRGIHISPYKKKIYILKGKIYDFSINLDTLEKTEIILNEGDHITIPENYGHAFYTFMETEVLYLLEGSFNASIEKTIYWNDPKLGFNLQFPKENIILSNKDREAPYYKKYDYYVLGPNGFLGKNCIKYLKKHGYTIYESNERLDNINNIREEIIKSNAKYVICAAGISGKPTIEWCETHEQDTYHINYQNMIDIMKLTNTLQIHCTIFGSGYVYNGDKNIYSEEDIPNYTDKIYCKWRCELEKHVNFFNNVLYLRIMYPITFDGNNKCFLTKMLKRLNTVHSTKLSLTIVPSLFPKIALLCEKNTIGIFNFVNRGSISLCELLDMYSIYKSHVDYKIIAVSDKGYELNTDKLNNILKIENIYDAFKNNIHSII